MSHVTRIKTQLKNLNAVQAALKRLGYQSQVDGTIQDYYGKQQKVDLAVEIPGQRGVGFNRKKSGEIELVGDWYGGRVGRQEFLDSLKCNYAREQVLQSLERQGIDLSKLKETEEPDGTVVFELPLDTQEMEMLAAGS